MKVTLDYTKSLHDNAATYFDKSKKAKKKLEGLYVALRESKNRLDIAKQKILEAEVTRAAPRKKQWYETKFRWTKTRNDLLSVGGKDATSNEMLIKKHVNANDLVLHTDMAGSPFFVLENGQDAKPEDIEDVAVCVGCYSRAWQKGFASIAVFYVKPEQVSKEAKSGESLAKGAFMIYGKTQYVHPKLELYIGVDEAGVLMSGSDFAVKKHCKKFVRVIPGSQKTSALAKTIREKLEFSQLDDIIRLLPAGNSQVVRG
ncbi:MAG: putative ribosome quality control (RQC) complex YloA/Tae2 family protein [Candidatus Woesearchaeota archaeon]|jgi:predicted ribosome quality control (RQC) complex YloA/Tae2 family protein